MTPGTIYFILLWVLIIVYTAEITRYFGCGCCNFLKSKTKTKIEKTVLSQRLEKFYDALSTKQREFWLREDVVNRNRNDL